MLMQGLNNHMRNFTDYTILSAKATTGAGNSILVVDFQHKEITLATNGMGAGDTITVKIQGSNSEDAPTWGSAQSLTNQWDYIQCVDMEDGSNIDGDTGITISDADDVRKLRVNVDGLRWITVIVTAISDTINTSITATINLFND